MLQPDGTAREQEKTLSQPVEPRPVENTEQSVQSRAGVEQRESAVTDSSGVVHRERSTRDVGAEQQLNIITVSRVVWLFVGIAEVMIGMRVLLKLIGANPANDFAGFVYNFAGVFLAPFFGLTGSPSSGGMVLEIPSIFAMLVYGVLGWVIVHVVLPLFDRPTTRSMSTYDRYKS